MKKLTYRVIRSSRKTVAIQLTPGGEVLVRCPRRMTAAQIEAFVRSKEGWIEKHLPRQPLLPAYTAAQLQEMTERAKRIIPLSVSCYARLLGVDYGRITIRHQKTRWGSCSAKGNLNFNCLLMEVPSAVLDYVVLHELCHRKHMDHSDCFWAEVARLMPDYRIRRSWLKEHGAALIGRIQ